MKSINNIMQCNIPLWRMVGNIMPYTTKIMQIAFAISNEKILLIIKIRISLSNHLDRDPVLHHTISYPSKPVFPVNCVACS